ncbi:hypothetical protein VHUM_02587 [Vanrija humicola]|uniref:Translation initiation factor 3 N-terminal domain-containing protein n=1 Tax=Vanrija humicola TaxID=5417 RepID=A0A7D8UZT6_VANHU|nr:hypothetical protein VHUM_02587 [Vanrija humicola]
MQSSSARRVAASASAATSSLYRLASVSTQQRSYHAAVTNFARRVPTYTSSQQCLSSLGTYSSARAVHTPAGKPQGPPRQQRPGQQPERQLSESELLELRNDEIPFAKVQLVDEDNKLGDPTSLKLILKTFDPTVDFLKLVQISPPIVKIINIEEDKARQREYEARVRLSRRMAIEDKELQVPWHAAVGDLQHKAATARSLIEKGDRVQLVFARRAGGSKTRWVSDEEKEQIVALFADTLSPVATRWKPDDRSRKAIWVSYWQPLESIRTEVRQKVLEGIVDKRKEAIDKKEERRLREQEKRRKAAERAAAKGL